LEWTDSDGSGVGGEGASRAGVECLLLDDGAAAEVTVSAPDRPGLLSDISRAIAATGFNIEKVRAPQHDRPGPLCDLAAPNQPFASCPLARHTRAEHAHTRAHAPGSSDDAQLGGAQHVPRHAGGWRSVE
jgi:ACT domain